MCRGFLFYSVGFVSLLWPLPSFSASIGLLGGGASGTGSKYGQPSFISSSAFSSEISERTTRPCLYSSTIPGATMPFNRNFSIAYDSAGSVSVSDRAMAPRYSVKIPGLSASTTNLKPFLSAPFSPEAHDGLVCAGRATVPT